jgi:hypothetical protein
MDYFDKNAEMFRENLKQYIIIDLKNNYYAYKTKPVEEIDNYETISKRWGVSTEYVKELAEESGYTLK